MWYCWLIVVLESILMSFPQLYHEATIVNLLETVLFYKVCPHTVLWDLVICLLLWLQESVEAAGDLTLDLVDYCYHRISWLIVK